MLDGRFSADVKKWTFGAPPHVKPNERMKEAAKKRLELLEKRLSNLNERMKKGNTLQVLPNHLENIEWKP